MSYSNASPFVRGNPQQRAVKKIHVLCEAAGRSVGDRVTIDEAGPSKQKKGNR
jgi:ribosomal protein S17